MVFLSKIYTRSGDEGETGLGDGTRVSKDHPRVNAYGTVDELNATLGLFVAQGFSGNLDSEVAHHLRDIQNDLFDVGADLCKPETPGEKATPELRVRSEQVTRLESWIDRYNEALEPLNSFVLPGGSLAASWCHLARTICRRAEREVVTLSHSETINPEVRKYLNRLSDFLFVLARECNNKGQNDVLWVPGKSIKQG